MGVISNTALDFFDIVIKEPPVISLQSIRKAQSTTHNTLAFRQAPLTLSSDLFHICLSVTKIWYLCEFISLTEPFLKSKTTTEKTCLIKSQCLWNMKWVSLGPSSKLPLGTSSQTRSSVLIADCSSLTLTFSSLQLDDDLHKSHMDLHLIFQLNYSNYQPNDRYFTVLKWRVCRVEFHVN